MEHFHHYFRPDRWDSGVDPYWHKEMDQSAHRYLMEGIKDMAKGNLDARINLKRGDELSELAQAFNQMAD